MITVIVALFLAPKACLSDLIGGWQVPDYAPGMKGFAGWGIEHDESTGLYEMSGIMSIGDGKIVQYIGVVTGKCGAFQMKVTSGLVSLGNGKVKIVHPKLRFDIQVIGGEMTLTPMGSDPYVSKSSLLWHVGYPRLRVHDLPVRSWTKPGII